MMMKLGCCCCGAPLSFRFLLLLLLFIAAFQTSDAVTCKKSHKDSVDTWYDKGTVECPTTCAYYDCPSTFYKKCAGFPKAVKFVQDHYPDKITYFDGPVTYVAGCKECLDDKRAALYPYSVELLNNFYKLSPENPIWYCAKPGDTDSCVATPEDANSGNSNGFIKLTAILVAAGWILAHI